MRQMLTLTVATLLILAAPLEAQTTAGRMYASMQTREQAARKKLDTTQPAETVRKDLSRIVEGYQSLVARFPRSGYSDNALWQAAMISTASYARYRVEEDRAAAMRLLKRLVTEYPSSSLVRQARPALARLKLEDATPEPALAANHEALPAPAQPPAASAPAAPKAAGLAELRAIRRTVLPDVIRIAIELDREVDYHDDRIAGPDRVFVDLQSTATSASVPMSQTFEDGVVKGVRLGPRPAGATRVVLDLEGAGRYNVFTLYHPFRVVVDMARGGSSTAAVLTTTAGSGPPDSVLPAVDEKPAPVETTRAVGAAPAAVPATVVESVPTDEAIKPAPPVDAVAAGATIGGSTSTLLPARRAAGTAVPSKAPPAVAPVAPAANLRGNFSLSRQLGLGISRIVIDPGHGGHDPGAQSHGVIEKDLVLDVALRLEKLLANTPGVDAVLTRRDDEFIPLEERTAIANRENADLFLSIHANASRNPKARGIETYFLNFASNPDAEAVAARENSASGQTMHNLPDIVKAITLNNKLDESRDFATLVQREMIRQLASSNEAVRNLGVKQAPFVVLIGAGMPSILAEISFVTHSQEGRLLRTSAYRQAIAEALYQGVRRYQQSLKAVKTVASQ
jgi:N-acetylmuramoyl-L-alanine amidase